MAHQPTNIGPHRWQINPSNELIITDSHSSVVLKQLTSNFDSVLFSFDYDLPSTLIDLKFHMHVDDSYAGYRAKICLDSASLDINNPVEYVVSLDQPECALTLPLYQIADATPKMRLKLLDGGSHDHKSKGLVAVESLGEGSAHLTDPSPPSLSDFYNMSRRDNITHNQCLNIDISSPKDTKRSIHLSIHSASFKVDESINSAVRWKRGGLSSSSGSSSPSLVYCVVYALDANGKHITPKNAQSSTSALAMKVGENNPIWNEQFDLYTPNIVSEFDTVRVKLKVNKSGWLKDRNLGMITIRAKDLFVDYSHRDESVKMKQFTLPMAECPNGLPLAETSASMKVTELQKHTYIRIHLFLIKHLVFAPYNLT